MVLFVIRVLCSFPTCWIHPLFSDFAVVQEEELNNALEQGVELTLPTSSQPCAQSTSDLLSRVLEDSDKSTDNAKTLTLAETKYVKFP